MQISPQGIGGAAGVRIHAHPHAGGDPRRRGRRTHVGMRAGAAPPLAAAPPTYGYRPAALPPGSVPLGPLEPGDQGISRSERTHADRAIRSLFTAPGVQWIATYRHDTGLYEISGRDGTLRFERWRTPDGRLVFRVHSIDGHDPIPGTDGRVLATLEEEIAAAGGPGRPVRPDLATYPDLLQRVAQLFDDRHAPDFVYIPFPGGDPNHPGAGSHGIPDITQSRAPLIMAGPGILPGTRVDMPVKNVDVAPTVAEFLGIAPIVGRNAAGAPAVQLLRWQDGHSLAGAVTGAASGARPYGSARRAVVFVLDGAGQTVMFDEIRKGNLPNIARIVAAGATFRNGSISDYPVVTWSNHNSIVTGASPGRHGIINNSWFDRDTSTERLITDGSILNSLRTGRLVDPKVETLYEAVRRTFGRRAVTAALNQPSGRGATMSTLDLTGLGLLAHAALGTVTRFLSGRRHAMDPRFQSDKEYRTASIKDNLAASIGGALFARRRPPKLAVFEFTLTDNQGHHHGPQHERARAALQEADRNVGRVLGDMGRRGLLGETLFVVTADHGMEHQSMTGTGGWKQALKRSGVKTVESTRFVYVRNVDVSVRGPSPRAGVTAPMAVIVSDDDTNADGSRRAVAGATVTVTDPSGRRWTATTGPDGVARLDVTPSRAGEMQVDVTHADFTRERSFIDVGH